MHLSTPVVPGLMTTICRRRNQSELRLTLLVRFFVVEPIHQGLSPRLATGVRIFLDLFQDLTSAILSMVW